MGAMQNNKTKGSKKSGGRGSVSNQSRLTAFAAAKGKECADWGACDPAKMLTVVICITELGGAVTFGLSRDQGAHSLTLMLDGDRETLWFNGAADLDAELDDVAAKLAGMS